MSSLRCTGSLFNSEASYVSAELYESPATNVLSESKSLALFLFVGVLTDCVLFLGITTLCSGMGWPDVLQNIVCFFGSVFSFLLTRCVVRCSSSLDNGVSCERLSDWLNVISFFTIGDVELSLVYVDLIGVDSATGRKGSWHVVLEFEERLVQIA